MSRFTRILLTAFVATADCVFAVSLPDTGVDTCYTLTGADGVPAANPASISRDLGTYPRQDCRYGYDPATDGSIAMKIGGGARGFDYTKIANDATDLPDSATLGTGSTDWACTRDNLTGLTWEVKTTSDLPFSGLRNENYTYTWYSADSTSNGGVNGSFGTNTCSGTLIFFLCYTEAYVAAVNASALCGYGDWRLPTVRELLTLRTYAGTTKYVDENYFPGVRSVTWSSTPVAADATQAWTVDFNGGFTNVHAKTEAQAVMLVRGNIF